MFGWNPFLTAVGPLVTEIPKISIRCSRITLFEFSPLIPDRLQDLVMEADKRGLADVLLVLRDEAYLPDLIKVPTLTEVDEGQPVDITVAEVHHAIAGLRRRRHITDIEVAEAWLWRLASPLEVDKLGVD